MADVDPTTPKTGSRWLDLLVAGCALSVSLASVLMARDSNVTQQKLLSASVWPYLVWDNSNYDLESHQKQVYLGLVNSGVGPAKLKSFQLFYKDQPLSNWPEMMKTCCDVDPQSLKGDLVLDGGIAHAVISPHDEIKFFRMTRTDADAEIWEKLNTQRRELRAVACYCSVLDECWVMDSKQESPQAVTACPAVPGPQYR